MYAEVATEVMAAVFRVLVAALCRCRVGKKILTLRRCDSIAVGVAVKHITAESEYLFVADIEVYTQGLRGVDAVAATETAEAARSTVGCAGIVDVVGRAEYGKLVAVPKRLKLKLAL